ncbi:MAG: hypothetical protein M3O30_10950 [Planctomycetota bacterium]|nr:hypothetical protein [Planctomycetota bacterium]
MAKNTNQNRITLVAAGALILLVSGCHDAKPRGTSLHEFFDPDGEARPSTVLMETQRAVGARADGTLYPSHFDGAALSSLGTKKLDYMLKDSHSCNPLIVYMAVPTDMFPSERRRAIGDFLMDHGGLKAEQIEFRDGPNPHTYSRVADNLKNYDKTDTGSEDGGGGGGTGAGNAMTGGH